MDHSPAPQSKDRAHAPLRRLLLLTAALVTACLITVSLVPPTRYMLAWDMMRTEDRPVLAAVIGLLMLLAILPVADPPARWLERLSRAPFLSVIVLTLAVVLVVVVGTHAVAIGFALSRDEAMAVFDAEVLAKGRLMASVAPEWRPFVPALQPEFRLNVPDNAGWISTYLPGNAAIRAVLGHVLPAALVNAVFPAVSVLALFAVARKLWPGRPDGAVLAALFAATSSQVLLMAATPYAMSAHLMLNLVWLWLFLRHTALSHAAAIAVGALATGLHQFVFHPLFVAPFLLMLLTERRWRLLALYTGAYGLIVVFWIAYWQLLLLGLGASRPSAESAGAAFLLMRIQGMLADFGLDALHTMALNLLRFAAWQNPAVLVLLVPGVAVAMRQPGVLRALALGIVLTLAATFMLMPYQDTGWGYRYLHGLIGNAVLLAVAGYISLTSGAAGAGRRAVGGTIAVLTAAAILLIPLHAVWMRARIEPLANAYRAVASSTAGAVVIDTIAIDRGNDLVRNEPDLANRPLTFDIGLLDDALVHELCSRMTVTVFTGEDAARFGVKRIDATMHWDYARISRLSAALEDPSCRQLLRPLPGRPQ